jgi:hypothetical protein
MSNEQAAAVWQEADGWHVRTRHPEGPDAVRVFKTRDEAIAYSESVFADGATSARAETQRGAAPLPPQPPRPA